MNIEAKAPAEREASETALVDLTLLPEAPRFNLRVAGEHRHSASAAFGVDLPGRVGQQAIAGARSALCLGPDEWVLYTAEHDSEALRHDFRAIAAEAPHSLTDISDRELTIELAGARAAELLTVGCPRNIFTMAPETGIRTVFDSAQVVLLRDAEDRWRLEVWRSFLPHVWGLLSIANRELSSGF